MKYKIEKLIYKSPLYALAGLHHPISRRILKKSTKNETTTYNLSKYLPIPIKYLLTVILSIIFFGLVLAAILIIAAATIISLVLEGISLVHKFISDKTHSNIPKAFLTTFVILFYAQFSSNLHNPISDCFKSIMKNLGLASILMP